jgi:hypothetical protein
MCGRKVEDIMREKHTTSTKTTTSKKLRSAVNGFDDKPGSPTGLGSNFFNGLLGSTRTEGENAGTTASQSAVAVSRKHKYLGDERTPTNKTNHKEANYLRTAMGGTPKHHHHKANKSESAKFVPTNKSEPIGKGSKVATTERTPTFFKRSKTLGGSIGDGQDTPPEEVTRLEAEEPISPVSRKLANPSLKGFSNVDTASPSKSVRSERTAASTGNPFADAVAVAMVSDDRSGESTSGSESSMEIVEVTDTSSSDEA